MPDGAARTKLYEDINQEFAKQLWNLWSQYTLWTVAYKPDVHGVLGPNLPDGTAAVRGSADRASRHRIVVRRR